MKVSVTFSLVSAKASDHPIRMRISYDCVRLDIRTGYVCPDAQWDKATQRMIPGTTNRYGENADKINAQLSKYEGIVRNILNRYDLDGKTPEPNILKHDFEIAIGRKKDDKGMTISEVWQIYMIEQKQWSINSARNNVRVYKKIVASDFGKCKITDVTEADFGKFFGKMISDGLENNSIYTYLTITKCFFKWAKRTHRYEGTAHEGYSVKLRGIGKKDIMYLEWQEFEQLYNIELDEPVQIEMRDIFCLCCATGMRISDCLNLEWKNCHMEGAHPHIAVIAIKTGSRSDIDLNKYSRDILNRQQRTDGKVFHLIGYGNMNNVLRKVARKANLNRQVRKLYFSGNDTREEFIAIKDAISTHWGRHTFIVRALSLGIAPTIVMSWTGHQSYDSMRPYIAIATDTKKDNMSRFDA